MADLKHVAEMMEQLACRVLLHVTPTRPHHGHQLQEAQLHCVDSVDIISTALLSDLRCDQLCS